MLLQSKEAFCRAAVDAYENERVARAVNGEIVTDSESDINPEDLVDLHDKVSKRISNVKKKCPNIGKTIEDFVSAGSIGADQWRRTGVLTFDGNSKVAKKLQTKELKNKCINAIFHMALWFSCVFDEIKDKSQQLGIRA